MPIPVAPVVVAPPPVVVTPSGETDPIVLVEAFDSYTGPSVTLEGNGVELSLSGDGFSGPVVLAGVTGVGMAPTQVFAAEVDNGSTPTGVRLQDRELFLPVLIGATSYVGLRTYRDRLHRLLDPEVGPVTVTVRQPDTGLARRATGYYTGGMEGAYGKDVAGRDWQTVGLTFDCNDPLAYGETASESWTVQGSARPFLSDTEDFFPVVLGSSLVGGVRQVVNAGEKDAWPAITVTGPGSGFVLTNVTTGKSFSLTGTITQPFTIDTRRGVADVYDASGDLWDRVTLASSLFPLVPGVNQIQVSMTGANSSSGVVMSWDPPYRSMH